MDAQLPLEDVLVRSRARLDQFEAVIDQALKEKYAHTAVAVGMNFDEYTHFFLVRRWDLAQFWDHYARSRVFPIERLPRLGDLIIDVKLQLYYISEIDLGLSNSLVYDRGYNRDEPLARPHVLLTKMSLDQGLIGKSRVLWERIMNLVYYLDTGTELEAKKSGRRSKRGVFLRFVGESARWRFLEPYIELVGEYDNRFRTPEYHEGSTLRANLLAGRETGPNILLDPLNRASKIWDNMLSIVDGGKAVSFDDLHEVWDGDKPRLESMPRPANMLPRPLDPKYLE